MVSAIAGGKRQSLKRKVANAPEPHQASTSSSGVVDDLGPLASPNDSGPYATIDEEETKRVPVGPLPAFISLAHISSSSGEEDEEDLASMIVQAEEGGGGNKDIVLEADEDCEERLI